MCCISMPIAASEPRLCNGQPERKYALPLISRPPYRVSQIGRSLGQVKTSGGTTKFSLDFGTSPPNFCA
jgi:hypothetical protein